ncbi:MAG TPA: single-stranded DNA-binding protein [Mycobacteriales bacterium]|nr:single-stranded DNA-binding protein [Mycobacteriales bacterium]
MPTRAAGSAPAAEHRNEVVVCGRLAAPAITKVLPSGDEVVSWRLVVDRADRSASQRVDVIDCSTFGARLRRQAASWTDGDLIEVTGALRRRFWRGGAGVQSRCEVEAVSAVRRARVPAPRRQPAREQVRRRQTSGSAAR